MKKLMFTLSLVALSGFSGFAQNQNANQNAINSNGNVGIGTNNPNFPLEVHGKTMLMGKLEVDSTTVFEDTLVMRAMSIAEDDLVVNGNLIMSVYRNSTLNYPRSAFFGPEGEFISIDDPCRSPIGFNGTPISEIPIWQYRPGIMYVECPENLKIGIKTPNPYRTLDIRGDQYLGGSLGIGTNDITTKLDIKVYDINTKACRVYNSTGGATPEDNELFVVPRLASNGYNSLSNENDFGIFWNDNAGNQFNESSGLVIGPNNLNLDNPGIKISSTGNIGIGSENPNYRLVVKNGNMQLNGGHGGQDGPRFVIKDESDSDFLRFANNSSGNWETRFAIDHMGKLYCREIEVTITNLPPVPDYVFEENYFLMPLDTLEQYIINHKHLPGVPSKKDLKDDGLQLAEMNLILLKKIEELTLYAIEQQKMIDKLQQAIIENTLKP